ncbi:MAG: response regulator transcription factor [Lachnospiraceae bacterium]|nr:response regulator transcription factor [Lachnospiraceae bacterium]MDD6192068.1 response regulator transcription factor [Lachnospiraceae bacterium]MDY4793841.1 response regulator transcription factor [Pararoseburia sp.]
MAVVYIVEDDENIREIEEFALMNAGHKVLGFENAKSFYKQMGEVLPDLVLLDVMLPDESGNEIVRKLRKNPDTKKLPIIMVTAKTTELDLVKGLEDGADDYIKKPFSVMELISRVKALLRRLEPEEIKQVSLDELTLNNEKHEVTLDGKPVELTFKEYELLQYLLINKGIVLSRDSIMDEIWGMAYEGESRTLDMHIKTLRHKLGDFGNHIRTVRNVGYVIE